MNERIKQISDEAHQFALDTIEYGQEFGDIWSQKFAELLIKECAELSVNSQYANTKSEYYEGFNEALVYAGNKILEHFGVEE